MANVFLSYDHEDAKRAAPIVSALEKAGHSVWWDRHIKGGAQYNDEIEAAVAEAGAVVVIWSERSVRSTWVRDEAAEGRDQGKLVPVLIDAIKPPMGFRQFQTIDLSRSSRGLKDTSLRQLLDTIDALEGISRASSPGSAAEASRRFGWPGRRIGLVAAVLALLAMAALLAWSWRIQPALAVVAVAASDASPRSQALSSELVVKLGTLAHVGASKWQLADPQSGSSNPDLVFRVGGTGSAAQPRASLVLLDSKTNSILWSREFAKGDRTDADLRLQLSLTAGRVLGCALEAREAGGLSLDLFKLFLAGCADEAEVSNNDPHKIASVMRTIVDQQPHFTPAWARLLIADSNAVGFADVTGTDAADPRKTLAHDIGQARRIAPDLPEIRLAEIDLLSPYDYAGALERIAQAKSLAADKASIWLSEPQSLLRVGRIADAIESARRAAELDPLSPAATTGLIMTLAYGGQLDLAKVELQRAERRWAGTDALLDAQWGFHLRFGDPRVARAMARAPYAEPYFRAREDPTPENVEAALAYVRQALETSGVGAIQVFGEFGRTDEVFGRLDRAPSPTVAKASYILFRPQLAEARRDPRFMNVVKRIGLLSYWQKSGKWPDFCYEPDLPYDCKKQAAKLAT